MQEKVLQVHLQILVHHIAATFGTPSESLTLKASAGFKLLVL